MPEHDPRDPAARATSPGAISGVAHELQTPIAAIRGAAAGLRRPGLDKETRARLLGVIEESSAQLQLLVDDLLAAGRLEAGRLPVEIEPCDPYDIASLVVETARIAGSTHIVLSHTADLGVRAAADPRRLREALASLVGNATRHSPPGAPVDVTVAATPTHVRISVADVGAGIAERDQERIFDAFVRLDEASVGTGLGLYLARGAARAMGGDLTVASEPGRGSTFALELLRVDAGDDPE